MHDDEEKKNASTAKNQDAGLAATITATATAMNHMKIRNLLIVTTTRKAAAAVAAAAVPAALQDRIRGIAAGNQRLGAAVRAATMIMGGHAI